MAQVADVAPAGVGLGAAADDGPLMGVDGRSISDRAKFLILLMLAGTYGLNMTDRGILFILMPLIKKDFQLDDLQIGILAGPIFAVVYGVCSLPLATLSDRKSRRNLIAVTMMAFSAATALCGLANSYIQLALGRFLTGSVESATLPAANSVISDLYSTEKRASATAIFTAGGSVGGIFAGAVGGYVAHHYGWREAFFVAGMPGLVLGLIIFFAMREPQRRVSQAIAAQRSAVPIWKVLQQLWTQPSFRWLCAGDAFMVMHTGGAAAFASVYMVQTFHFNVQQLGFIQSILGVGGIAVTVLLGRMIAQAGARDIRWLMYAPAIIAFLGIPFSSVPLLVHNGWLAITVSGVGMLFHMAFIAPVYATTQSLVPNAMRARSIAVLMLLVSTVGTGLGGPIAGAMSKFLTPHYGHIEALRLSLLMFLVTYLLAGFSFWRAARTVRADIDRARAMDGLPAGA